ncbi:hypothetical protein ACFLTV_02515 [Chloroflexota bacterium]
MKYPGAYRQITGNDVEDMTISGLIGRYRYYSESLDGEIIRGILQYEQLREKRPAIQTTKDKLGPPTCKICEQPLPPEPENKTGRPKAYCSACETLRNQERKKKSRRQRKKHYKQAIT